MEFLVTYYHAGNDPINLCTVRNKENLSMHLNKRKTGQQLILPMSCKHPSSGSVVKNSLPVGQLGSSKRNKVQANTLSECGIHWKNTRGKRSTKRKPTEE